MSKSEPDLRDATRFWLKVEIDPHGCWEWQGGKTHDGYGLFRIGGADGVMRGAHRVAVMLSAGSLSDAQVVRHDCDNPGCVRPDHLIVGSTLENNADAAAKGRYARRHNRLRRDEIGKIRAAATLGESKSSIARRFGVGRGAVTNLLLGKTYKGVK